MTWPFYLLPAFAAEQFLDARLKFALADDDTGNATKLGRAQSVLDDRDLSAIGSRLSNDSESSETETSAGSQNALPEAVAVIGELFQPLRSAASDGEAVDVATAEARAFGGGGSNSTAPAPRESTVASARLGDDGSSGDGELACKFEPGPISPLVSGLIGPVEPAAGLLSPVIDAGASAATDLAVAAEPLVDTIAPVLGATSDTLGNLVDATDLAVGVEPLVDSIAPVLGATSDTLGDLVDATLAPVGSAVDATTSALETTVDSASALATDLLGTADQVIETTGVVDRVAPAADAVAPLIEAGADTVADLTGVVPPAIEAVTPVLDATAEAAEEVVGASLDTLADLTAGVTEPADAAIASLEPDADITEAVLTSADSAAAPVTDAVEAASSASESIDEIGDAVGDAAGDVIDVLPEAGPALPAALTETVTATIDEGDITSAAASGEDVVASDGVIAIEEGPVPPADLFADGRYTDLGISLADDSAAPTAAPSELPDPEQPAAENPAPAAADDDSEDLAPAAPDVAESLMPDLATAATTELDDFGLR
jgi:hypothetical protein